MLGRKTRTFKTHIHLSIEDLVPANNFYRQLDAKVDLSFVRDLVKSFYTPCGRPSVDPVVFFKLQLIMLFEGIRSERQLMEQVNLNLAFRWYIGYDLDESVPNHSSLTKIRERYSLSVFRKFFEQIVELCIQAGLVWGKELYFDGTRVQANADIDSSVSNFEYQLHHHLNILFPDQEPVPLSRPEKDFIETWIEAYQEPADWKQAASAYQSLAAQQTSLTDADATPLRTDPNGNGRLGYHTHYVVDGGRNRIILGVLVTPSSIQDNQPMLDLERWVRFRWRIEPYVAVGDSKYGSIDNIVGLLRDRIIPLMPRIDYSKGKQFYPNEMFRYDAEHDVYYCPQGHVLKRQGNYNVGRNTVYRGKKKICDACPVRSACTNGKRGRNVHRSWFQVELDKAAAYRKTPLYTKAMNKRRVWVEPLFGEGKQWHGLTRFRLRRLWRVNREAFLIASVQNIKRLLKPRYGRKKNPSPAASAALFVLSTLLSTFSSSKHYQLLN